MESVALAEWHIDPEVIFETWTDEKLLLLVERRNVRIKRLNRQESGEEEDAQIQDMEQLRDAARQRYLASKRPPNKP